MPLTKKKNQYEEEKQTTYIELTVLFKNIKNEKYSNTL